MSDKQPLSDKRLRSINFLCPQLESKLIVDNIKPRLHVDAGGFLNEVEMISVFSGQTRVDHVRALLDILKTKDNHAFGSFCTILEATGYGHWSRELQMHAGLDCQGIQGSCQLDANVQDSLLRRRTKAFRVVCKELNDPFEEVLASLQIVLQEVFDQDDFARFVMSFLNRLRDVINITFTREDLASPTNLMMALAAAECYSKFNLQVLDVMVDCLVSKCLTHQKDIKGIMDNYRKTHLGPIMEKTLSDLTLDSETCLTLQPNDLNLALVLPDSPPFCEVLRAKDYLLHEMGIKKAENLRFDFGCVYILLTITYASNDLQKLLEEFLHHQRYLKEFGIHRVLLVGYWSLDLCDGTVVHMIAHEINPPMPVKKFHPYLKCARVVSGSLVATKTNNSKGGVIVPVRTSEIDSGVSEILERMATKSPICRIEPGGKYDIIEEFPPMPLKELHGYVKDRYPQCVKVLRGSLVTMPAKNAKPGVIVPGEFFIILSSKIVPCMKVRGVGHQLILVPITSETEFALIPNDDRDSERKLNKDWEGTFTDVSQILQLPILPQALCVQSDFESNDHKKPKLSRGDILYNIKVIKAGKLKTRRGIKGVSSDGTTYTFWEAEPVDFSSKQIDTKTTLHWFMKVVPFPQRARVFARGDCDIPGISNHSEVTFTDHGSNELLVVKKLGDDPSNIMYINVNSDVKVAAVELKDCEEYYDIVMERPQFCIRTSSFSQMLPEKNKNEDPRHLVTESPCEPKEINHPYENYNPWNERDYYNYFDPKPSQSPDKQASRSQLVRGDSKEVLYSAVYDVPLKDEVKISNYSPREKKKSSSHSRSGCELKQSPGLHQPTSAAKLSLSDGPSDIHLRHYVTDKIGKDWGRLAIYLGLDYSCVEQIKQDLDNAEEQCFRVLIEWLRGKGAEPKTWEVLLTKLESSGRKDISDEIREKIENGTLDDF